MFAPNPKAQNPVEKRSINQNKCLYLENAERNQLSSGR